MYISFGEIAQHWTNHFRSAKKELVKEEAKIQEMQQLQNTISELFIQTEEQGAYIRELTRKLGYLGIWNFYIFSPL